MDMRDEINKKIFFADMILGLIKNVERPILMYDEEKIVVEEALTEYKERLEGLSRGR